MSFSAATDSSVLPSPFELNNMVLHDQTVIILNETFPNDTTSSAHLRHYSFVSQNIQRLKHTLDQYYQEQNELFEHMMANDQFRTALQPIVHHHRRRTRASRFNPYTERPLSSRSHIQRRAPTPHPPSSSSSSKSLSSKSSSNESVLSYYTTGTKQNPINVDISIQKPMTTGTSNVDERKPPQPTCKRCGQTGHLRPDCDTRIRSFTHCDICDWMGRKQMLCDHYDISPVGFRKLRGNIPFDDND